MKAVQHGLPGLMILPCEVFAILPENKKNIFDSTANSKVEPLMLVEPFIDRFACLKITSPNQISSSIH